MRSTEDLPEIKGPKTILVVEDDQTVADLLQVRIGEMGLYDVVHSSNVVAAESVFIPGKFLVVLLDLHLGKSIEEGIYLAKKFRELDPFVIIVAVTGFFPVFDCRLIESIDDLVQKPLDLTVMQYRIMLWSIKYCRRMDLIEQISTCVQSRFSYYKREIEDIREIQSRIQSTIESIEKIKASRGNPDAAHT